VLLLGPEELAGAARVDLLGAGALVVASLSWAIGSLASRHVSLPASPSLGTAMEMLAGGGLLLVVGVLTGEPARLAVTEISTRSLLAVAYLVVFGSLVAFSAFVWLLRVADTAKVATYAYVNPVVALLLGWAMAGEELSARTLLSSVVILGGVVLITTFRSGSRPVRESAGEDVESRRRGGRASWRRGQRAA
jgi:drug/metabolite transporter (DMT)-like permease